MRKIVIACIRGYQLLISPLLGPCCRFTPSCSRYACICVQEHGILRGAWLSLRRLLRCHPWHAGGIDVPPPAYQKPSSSAIVSNPEKY